MVNLELKKFKGHGDIVTIPKGLELREIIHGLNNGEVLTDILSKREQNPSKVEEKVLEKEVLRDFDDFQKEQKALTQQKEIDKVNNSIYESLLNQNPIIDRVLYNGILDMIKITSMKSETFKKNLVNYFENSETKIYSNLYKIKLKYVFRYVSNNLDTNSDNFRNNLEKNLVKYFTDRIYDLMGKFSKSNQDKNIQSINDFSNEYKDLKGRIQKAIKQYLPKDENLGMVNSRVQGYFEHHF